MKGATKYAVLTVPLLLIIMGCMCGSDEEEAAEAAQQLAEAMQQASQQPTPTPTPTPAAGGGGSNFGTVSLSPGFMPDPHTASGTSGGAVNAGTWNAACAGWVSQTPDHLFAAGGMFSNIRIIAKTANATQDTTLVVQKPDGSYACDDDTEGMNPIVVLQNAPAGTYKVWIGSYSQGENYQYTLGFTELSTTTAASL